MAAPSDTSHNTGPAPAERLHRIQCGEARGLLAASARGLLFLASLGYACGRRLHRGLYALGLRRRARLPRPVLSVGNLTAGGAGKTPLVAWLCQRFLESGQRPVVLARGYGRQPGEDLNDEGHWLRRQVPELPVLQQSDRCAAGLGYLSHAPADVFVLDDGFQHERLHRDLDLVLVDGLRPFGYGHRLPRGLLRDPPRALSRADVVLLTRAEGLTTDQRERLSGELRRLAPDALHGVVRFQVPRVRHGDVVHPAQVLHGERVFVLCGVGHPQSVVRTVEALGAEVAGSWFLPDHHEFCRQDLEQALAACREQGARLVVTAKDQVKLARLDGAADQTWVLEQEVWFEEGEEALRERLGRLTGGAPDREPRTGSPDLVG